MIFAVTSIVPVFSKQKSMDFFGGKSREEKSNVISYTVK